MIHNYLENIREDTTDFRINLLDTAEDIDSPRSSLALSGTPSITVTNANGTTGPPEPAGYTIANGVFGLTDAYFTSLRFGETATVRVNYAVTDGLTPSTPGTVTLVVHGERDVINGSGTIAGSAFGDDITGSAGVDVISGNAGDDLIVGQVGDDTLYGNQGNDELHGGLPFGVVAVFIVITKVFEIRIAIDLVHAIDHERRQPGQLGAGQ